MPLPQGRRVSARAPNEAAMPYLVMFFIFILLGLLATCALA